MKPDDDKQYQYILCSTCGARGLPEDFQDGSDECYRCNWPDGIDGNGHSLVKERKGE